MIASRLGTLASIAFATVLTACVVVPLPLPSGCAGCGAGADSRPRTLTRGAVSGLPQRVGFFYAVNEDCTSSGLVQMSVKQPPAHGSTSFVEIEDHPSFPRGPFYGCNKNKVRGLSVMYTSVEGFTGADHFSVQGVGPKGKLLTTNYSLTVIARQTSQ